MVTLQLEMRFDLYQLRIFRIGTLGEYRHINVVAVSPLSLLPTSMVAWLPALVCRTKMGDWYSL